MNVLEKASRTLSRPRARGRPNLQLSLLDSPISWPRPRSPEPASRPSKLMSIELELGGLAIEFKAKSLAGLLTCLSLGAAGAAVLQELTRPPQFRTWHGRVAGIIPYDFRKPTPRRIRNAFWAPDNPRLFTDPAFGVGWSVNLAQVPRALRGTWQPRPGRAYTGPKVTTTP